MPRLIPYRLAATCLLALLFSLFTATAIARGPVVQLRVIGTGGKTLFASPVGAGAVGLKTNPKATCFGAGTGGSGKTVQVKGGTALAALANAAKSAAVLRPLAATDHFRPEFGLGLCGVGKSKTTAKLSWYLKVNHKNPPFGGEQVKVHAGDEVLWALEPYPYPAELSLSAPASAEAGKPFTVTVVAYDNKGKKKPVAGAQVTGAVAPTDAEGHTTVVLNEATRLTAHASGKIPSNEASVCVGGTCPAM